jgi:hypothetical protein
MIAPFLLLAAATTPDAAPPAAEPFCVRAVGSRIALCGTPPQTRQVQQTQQPQQAYRLPRLAPKTYGPALPSAQSDLGHGVRATLRGRASNSGKGRRNRPVATVSVPF